MPSGGNRKVCLQAGRPLESELKQPKPPTDHFQDHPVVIIEVLSDSTRRTDLGEKRHACLTIPSPKVLIFVEPDSPEILVQRLKPEGGFAIELHSGPETILPLPEIDAELPLAELDEDADA